MKMLKEPGLLQYLHGDLVVASVRLTPAQMATVLNRAMNTWEPNDQPKGLLDFSDDLLLAAVLSET
jgi:hypothetical protein